MRIRSWAAFGAALTVCASAQAASAWATHGELGLVMSRGITNTDSGDAKFEVARKLGRWIYSGGVAALYASTNGIATAEDENGRLGINFALSKRTFWFGALRYDRNLFNGFAYQASVASGFGRILLDSKSIRLSAELGAGYRRELPEVLTLNSFGEVIGRNRLAVVNDPVMQAGVKFRYEFTSNAKVLNTMLVESGPGNTMSIDNLSLRVTMHKHLALSVGVDVTNNTNPPGGDVRHTQTVMTVNLVYNFSTSKAVSVTQPIQTMLQGLDLP